MQTDKHCGKAHCWKTYITVTSEWRCVLKHTKRQVKRYNFRFSTKCFIVMFITAVCPLFFLRYDGQRNRVFTIKKKFLFLFSIVKTASSISLKIWCGLTSINKGINHELANHNTFPGPRRTSAPNTTWICSRWQINPRTHVQTSISTHAGDG